MSEYDDPGGLWPDPTPPPPAPAPMRWVWELMEPAERRERLHELRPWVDWLRRTYPTLGKRIAPCWYQHSDAREILTALYIGWVHTYLTPSPGLGQADWITTAHTLATSWLHMAACATGEHQAPPAHAVEDPDEADDAFALYLTVAPDITGPSEHPAEIADERLAADDADPPL